MEQETNNIENEINNLTNDDQISEQIAHNVTGTVKWFNRVKGFGFVTRDDTKEDILIHHSGIKPEDINNKRQSRKRYNLYDQEKVIFDVFRNGKLMTAKNLVGKNGYSIIDQIAFKRGITPLNTQIINDTRLTGKVKWFNVKTRFGYVQCDYNNEDVYVNAVSIVRNNPEKYKPSLADGELIEFDLLKRPNGKLEAVNVTGPNGEPVTGSEYSPDKVDKAKQNVVEKSLQGKVKWFNLKSGFGYITRNDNGQDIYVHYTSVAKKNPSHRLRSLGDGEIVVFNIVDTKKGFEAVDVSGPDGAPVIGSQYAKSSNRRNSNQNMPQRDRAPRNDRTPRRTGRQRRDDGPQQQQQQQQNGSPRRRRPMNPRSTSGPRRRMNNDDNMRRPPRRNTGPLRNNYSVNPYNTNNYYNNDEPLYFAFKPKNIQYENNNGPRRVSYDRYMNMVNRPNNQRNGGRQNRGGNNKGMSQSDSQNTSLVLVAERVSGFCKWFNYLRGFGYVTRYDNRQDLYVNRSAIQRVQQNGVMPSLDEGEQVEFDICQDAMNNIMAVNVTGPNNSLLKGSRYANLSKQQQQQQQQQGPLKERSPIQTKVYRRRRMAN